MVKKINILNLSYSKDYLDGGISSAIKDLQTYQNLNGINSEWITERDSREHNYRNYVLDKIKQFNTNIIHVHGLWRSS